MLAAVALMTFGLAALAWSVLAVAGKLRRTVPRSAASAITLNGRDTPLSPDDQRLLRALIGTRPTEQACDDLDLGDLTGPARPAGGSRQPGRSLSRPDGSTPRSAARSAGR